MANTKTVKALGLSLIAVFVLTACGQKRALYLPEEPVTNSSTEELEANSESAEQGKD